MVRLSSDSYSLWKEKIEDGVFYAFYLFGRREPVLSRGNPHWKELGESSHVHFLTPLSPSLLVREIISLLLLLLTVASQRLYRSLERLYRWFLALTSFDRAVVPLLPGGGTATMLSKD